MACQPSLERDLAMGVGLILGAAALVGALVGVAGMGVMRRRRL